MPHGEMLQRVEITADTIRRGDVITVGGTPLRVLDLLALQGGAKRVRFHTGESMTMLWQTRMTAVRLTPPSVRAYRYHGRPVPSTPENLRAFLNGTPLPRTER